MKLSSLVALVCMGLLSGCAMSKKDCQMNDWYKQGLDDAKGGKALSSGEQHRQFCLTKHQVNVELTSYQQGWQAGMQQYCSYSNGFEHGTKGYTNYNENICSAELKPQALRGYNYGMCRYNAGVEVRKLEDDIEDSNQKIENMDARSKEATKDTKKDDLADWRQRRADARSTLYTAQARLPYAIVDERRTLQMCEQKR